MVEATSAKFSQMFYTSFFYHQDHPLYNNQAAKFPTILDSFILGVDYIRQVPTEVGGGGGRWARRWF